ncbi:hypothetical protein NEOLI_000241 [Neolecta irregularis DAH-3]|uniref:Uncharacterized protein n=1 Tax=Neolecta irregularis (strain DAH-3) TaxID=1198029 RepID=A0A1U7LIY3_NEOID|nr:hypothetical protein NEOLI_000241 [Neolecta irregularis DAH-3]|eukprot:OLL22615.1 hypothetical protein NEOLI_000241 [Neolecta irregularis DAH-3]
MAPNRGLEALDAHDSKEELEKGNEGGDVEEEDGVEFEAVEGASVAMYDDEDTAIGRHGKDMEKVVGVDGEGDPVGEDADELELVEEEVEECGAGRVDPSGRWGGVDEVK